MKHLLKVTDLSIDEIGEVFRLAAAYKRNRAVTPKTLEGQSWGMIFYKNSTRTRVSFEVGLHELGAHPLVLSSSNTQLSRGESVADTARVLSRYVHGLVIRCYDHSILEEFASAGNIPIINALSDFTHPCQILADLFSMAEKWTEGDDFLAALAGRKVAFLGDTNCNMANSWLLAGAHLGVNVALGGPESLAPGTEVRSVLAAMGKSVDGHYFTDPHIAAQNADVVYTDVWVSMGAEAEQEARLQSLAPYQVNASVMADAKPDAHFMHCLPAHLGEEVSADVYEGAQSIVFDQAENRLHVQKAILSLLAGK
ncbi:ornithine carbamoyltransferase [Cerasicoccus arenae]|uniref:Ornithine carbamoyltransferase n=1 Tax=Cerasicoccus arenae TaxID=424488 RepID=A0A8J3GCK0_9BACT|nr:ornithine carbamoyltransferase [Cerasicoccus arenae]MBK1856964.1 ornithine carbamoyltransferase [Cerasicoccus arenae]GHB90094.1 ornithine carbamoyltransferase [Cerasicoccus arenae]